MTFENLQPFEQSFMISPRLDATDNPSRFFSPSDSYLLETFHQYPHGDFRPTFYNPFEIKHRRRTSRAQLQVLEDMFAENPKPNAAVRRILAQKLEMTPRGVQIWFQNRRAKAKSIKTKKEEWHPNVNHTILSLVTTAAAAAVASTGPWMSDQKRVIKRRKAYSISEGHLNEPKSNLQLSPHESPKNDYFDLYNDLNLNSTLDFTNQFKQFNKKLNEVDQNCQGLNFDYTQHLPTPPMTAAGSPTSLGSLYQDPIILPNHDLYFQRCNNAHLNSFIPNSTMMNHVLSDFI